MSEIKDGAAASKRETGGAGLLWPIGPSLLIRVGHLGSEFGLRRHWIKLARHMAQCSHRHNSIRFLLLSQAEK